MTLEGTCLAGAVEVTLDGVALPGFKAVSDAVLRLTVPPGATGIVVVKTPLGQSTPWTLH